MRTRLRTVGLAVTLMAGLMLVGCCETQLNLKIGSAQGFQTNWKMPTEPFQTGERIRFYLESPHDCFVYILNRGTSGVYNVLVPNPNFHQAANFLKANQPLELPSQVPGSTTTLGRGFAFDWRTGSEEIVIVASKTAVQELERLYASPDRSIATVDRILNDIVLRGGPETHQRVKTQRDKKLIRLKMQSPSDQCRPIVYRQIIRHEQAPPAVPAHPGGPTPGAPNLSPPGGNP